MVPWFVGGLGRSGTTLLVDALGCHPDVSPVYETAFVVQIIHLLARPAPRETVIREIRRLMDGWSRDLPHRPSHKQTYERFVHGPHYILFSRDDVLRRTEAFIDELPTDPQAALQRYLVDLFAEHARLDGKPYWVNKMPAYIQHAPFLRLLFPNMVMLHIIRDPRDVVVSTMSRQWGPNTVESACRRWVQGIRDGHRFAARYPGMIVELRYEDLLRDPSASLARAFDAVGLTLPASLIPTYQAAVGGFDPDRIGHARDRLTAADHDLILKLAGPEMARLGYPHESDRSPVLA